MKTVDIFKFKQEVNIAGDTCVYYRLIGCNTTIVHDNFEETIQVMDGELGSDEHCRTYTEGEFFDVYGGYHMGTEDVSIEDLVKVEWAMMIDQERNARVATAEEMKSFNRPVTAGMFNFESH